MTTFYKHPSLDSPHLGTGKAQRARTLVLVMEFTEGPGSPRGGLRVGFREKACGPDTGDDSASCPLQGGPAGQREGFLSCREAAVSSSLRTGPQSSSDFQLQKVSNADQ